MLKVSISMNRITSKVIGYHCSPFVRIGGHVTYPPPLLAIVQTDGSYRFKEGKIGAILTPSHQLTTYSETKKLFAPQSCTETEWAAIAYGLHMALDKGEEAIGVENDNLGVVGALMLNKNPKQEYAKYYKDKILTLTKQSMWVGIRWIPREMNKADGLLR